MNTQHAIRNTILGGLFSWNCLICNNSFIPGPGYTYPNHPDSFPGRCERYHNPTEYVNNPRTGYCQAFLPLIHKDPTPTPTPTPTATPTPLPTATPTPIPCVEGQDLIINGDLEQDVGEWEPWVQIPDPETNFRLFASVTETFSYTGRSSNTIWLGGQNDATEEIYQVITLPDWVNGADTTFWLYVTTKEATSTQVAYDDHKKSCCY